MEAQSNRKMRAYFWGGVVLVTLEILVNLFVRVATGGMFRISPFNVIMVVVAIYGLLSALGYFKVIISSDEVTGQIKYEANVPLTAVFILRALQLGVLLIFMGKVDVSFLNFGILIVVDFVYYVFLLIFKGQFYYVSELIAESEDEF